MTASSASALAGGNRHLRPEFNSAFRVRSAVSLQSVRRAYRQFDNLAVLGEEVHAPGVAGFDHRAAVNRRQQRRPCNLISAVGVPPDNPILSVCTHLLAGGHIHADEDTTVRRSNECEELGGALRSPPDRKQPVITQFQGDDLASDTIQGKDPAAQRIGSQSRGTTCSVW
jgi:hypothetical protein